jgi:hypothetical protein
MRLATYDVQLHLMCGHVLHGTPAFIQQQIHNSHVQRSLPNGRKCPFGSNGHVMAVALAVAVGQRQRLCSGIRMGAPGGQPHPLSRFCDLSAFPLSPPPHPQNHFRQRGELSLDPLRGAKSGGSIIDFGFFFFRVGLVT